MTETACASLPTALSDIVIRGHAGCMTEFRHGDLDFDGDVDSSDIGIFMACVTGADQPLPTAPCNNADVDNDHDGDQVDFGLLQRCMSDAGVMPDCHACARY